MSITDDDATIAGDASVLSDSIADHQGVFGGHADDIFGSITIGVEDIVSNFGKESTCLIRTAASDIEKALAAGFEDMHQSFLQHLVSNAKSIASGDTSTYATDGAKILDEEFGNAILNIKNNLTQHLVDILDLRFSTARASLLKHRSKIIEKLEIVRRYAAEERRVHEISTRSREAESMRLYKTEVTQKHDEYINRVNAEREVVIKIRAEKLANDLSICYKSEINALKATVKDLEEKLEVISQIDEVMKTDIP